MGEDIDFYTETMAKIYAKQGHPDKSAKIYRYLLDQEPGRQDLCDALAEIEAKIAADVDKKKAEIVFLFNTWIDLFLGTRRLKILKKIQRQLGDG
jgi:hypothetical protein